MSTHFIQEFNIKFWIFIPVYNFGKFLDECLTSVYNQTYKNYVIYIIDDGSTDNSRQIIKKWIPFFNTISVRVIIEFLSTNMGPGYTKWKAINYMRQHANKNDIFTILDGDDRYATDFALAIISDAYIENKCWFTYGSIVGAYDKQQNQITKDYIQTMRKNQEPFPFSHPRSCIIFLLDYLHSSDFQDKNNKWLLRITDRKFIYKCVELSGFEKICFIDKIIYEYQTHETNCRNLVSQKYKYDVVSKIENQAPLKPISEKIHVVMCCYRRHHNLSTIIQSLDNQTVASHIVFHIINTNVKKWNDTVIIKETTPVKNITIRLCNTGANLYGYARFLYTKHLLKTDIVPYVIYVDDDQLFPSQWIEQIYAIRKPLIYASQYGSIFKRFKTAQEYNYWDRTFNNSLGNKKLLLLPDNLDYGGTCGCIVDTHVFQNNIFFRCPKKYRGVEDLWLSYIVNVIIDKKIILFPNSLDPKAFNDTYETSLFRTLIKRKTDFLILLVKTGFLQSEPIININELNKILEPDDDSDLLISKFIYK